MAAADDKFWARLRSDFGSQQNNLHRTGAAGPSPTLQSLWSAYDFGFFSILGSPAKALKRVEHAVEVQGREGNDPNGTLKQRQRELEQLRRIVEVGQEKDDTTTELEVVPLKSIVEDEEDNRHTKVAIEVENKATSGNEKRVQELVKEYKVEAEERARQISQTSIPDIRRKIKDIEGELAMPSLPQSRLKTAREDQEKLQQQLDDEQWALKQLTGKQLDKNLKKEAKRSSIRRRRPPMTRCACVRPSIPSYCASRCGTRTKTQRPWAGPRSQDCSASWSAAT